MYGYEYKLVVANDGKVLYAGNSISDACDIAFKWYNQFRIICDMFRRVKGCQKWELWCQTQDIICDE